MDDKRSLNKQNLSHCRVYRKTLLIFCDLCAPSTSSENDLRSKFLYSYPLLQALFTGLVMFALHRELRFRFVFFRP